MTEWLLLLAAVVLTAATGFFVAAEFSLTTVDRGRAEEAAADGDARARSVVRALRALSTQLSAAQLGITITTLVVGYLAEPAHRRAAARTAGGAGPARRPRRRRSRSRWPSRWPRRCRCCSASSARRTWPSPTRWPSPPSSPRACAAFTRVTGPVVARAAAAGQLDRPPAGVRAAGGAGHRPGRRRAGRRGPAVGRGGRPVPRRRPAAAAVARAAATSSPST